MEDWWSELGERSCLEWFKRVKEDFGIEEYVKVLDNYEVRLRFRLRTGSAGLLVDKKRCGMCEDMRCVLCDGGQVEDLGHFLVECEEFQMGRRAMISGVRDIRGAREWVDSFENGGKDEKILLLLGKKVEGMEECVGQLVDAWVMRCVGEWWQRRKILLFGSG